MVESIKIDDSIELRVYQKSDANRLQEFANNRNVSQYLRTMPFPYEMKHAEKFIDMMKDPNQDRCVFAIVFDRIIVGSIGLHRQTDFYAHSLELGYAIDEKYWGRGIASRIVPKMIEFGFNNFSNVSRIFAGVMDVNPASERILQKSGFQKEGVRSKAIKRGDMFCDEILYAIVK